MAEEESVQQAPAAGAAGVVGTTNAPKVTVVKEGKKKKKHGGSDLKDADGRPIMRVKVYSPFKNYFDEYAYSITAINHTGPFDVLPRHHNFMTLIDACDMMITAPTGDKTIRISRAVMHVKYDQIVVFLDV